MVLAGTLVALPLTGMAGQEATPVAPGRLLQPGVELADVLDTAREGQDGAEVRRVSLDDWEEDELVFVVGLDNGAEIHIGATTGEVLRTLDAGSATAIEPEIGFVEAQETALAGQADAAVDWIGLNDWDGTLVYEVVLDNGVNVEIDAATGDVLATE